MCPAEYLKPRRSSILDVAERAGVSRQTVTRAMNDMADISEQTKQKVLQAARELHYRPSRHGRGLVKQHGRMLGLVVVDLRNPYYAELASSVLTAAARRGWDVLVTEIRPGRDDVLEELSVQVDAIVGHFEISEHRLVEVFGDMPVVMLGHPESGAAWGAIDYDFAPGMAAVLDHLQSSGRSRIVMLDCSLGSMPSERGLAFRTAADCHGIEPLSTIVPIVVEPDLESGKMGIRRIRQDWPDVDAIVCFNDAVAIGAMKELRATGLRIPDDVAVVGIDGLPIGALVTPELTTLVMDIATLGEAALRLVVGMSSGELPLRGSQVRQSFAHRLEIRESA